MSATSNPPAPPLVYCPVCGKRRAYASSYWYACACGANTVIADVSAVQAAVLVGRLAESPNIIETTVTLRLHLPAGREGVAPEDGPPKLARSGRGADL